jgi:catechol 2,3-dioxygenase-like lactoylglutathione lyase family enzyme
MAAIFKSAQPYKNDALNLPVASVETAVPFYERVMGFHVISRRENPKTTILGRDEIRIGLSENGGDPAQEGCFFEVDDVAAAFAELKSRGLPKESPDFRVDHHGTTSWKVFFVIAPDGLCYCLGQRLPAGPL